MHSHSLQCSEAIHRTSKTSHAMLQQRSVADNKSSRFGFRYWRDPGPWAGSDASSQLHSFVNAVAVAGFCMGGPEYISSMLLVADSTCAIWRANGAFSDCRRSERSSAHYSSCFSDYHGSLAYLLCGRWVVRWCKSQLHQERAATFTLTCYDRSWFRRMMKRTRIEH